MKTKIAQTIVAGLAGNSSNDTRWINGGIYGFTQNAPSHLYR